MDYLTTSWAGTSKFEIQLSIEQEPCSWDQPVQMVTFSRGGQVHLCVCVFCYFFWSSVCIKMSNLTGQVSAIAAWKRFVIIFTGAGGSGEFRKAGMCRCLCFLHSHWKVTFAELRWLYSRGNNVFINVWTAEFKWGEAQRSRRVCKLSCLFAANRQIWRICYIEFIYLLMSSLLFVV